MKRSKCDFSVLLKHIGEQTSFIKQIIIILFTHLHARSVVTRRYALRSILIAYTGGHTVYGAGTAPLRLPPFVCYPNAEIRYVVRHMVIVQCFIGDQAQLIHDSLGYTEPVLVGAKKFVYMIGWCTPIYETGSGV